MLAGPHVARALAHVMVAREGPGGRRWGQGSGRGGSRPGPGRVRQRLSPRTEVRECSTEGWKEGGSRPTAPAGLLVPSGPALGGGGWSLAASGRPGGGR